MRLLRSFFALATLGLVASFAGCNCGGEIPCESGGDCPEGQACDADDSVCREALTCAACAENQLCEEGAAGEDAVCQEDCEEGFNWDGTACVDEPTGCDLCAEEYRACIEEEGPVCGACLEGFELDAADNCVPQATCDPAPAEGSILAQCDDENRVCEEDADGAFCAGCALGFVEVDGACEAEIPCDQDLIDACEGENRTCVEEPNGQCGECLPGFIAEVDEEGAITSCRAPITCDQLDCTGLCNPASTDPDDPSDAFCSDTCTGPGGNPGIEDQDGVCVECGDCDGPGEDGPYLVGLFAGDTCVCQSQPGYFFDPAFAQTTACDADDDGWSRETAKAAQESGDPVVTAVFQCDVRTINTVVLENELGETKVIDVDPPAALFEATRNDDQSNLDAEGLTPYGSRELVAEELNSLTKVCAGTGPSADYNGNGVPDVDEFHEMDEALSSDIHAPFVAFTYFVELYRGAYEPPSDGVGPGVYRITARSRASDAPAAEAVPLYIPDETTVAPDGGAPEVTNGYWRQCTRFVDAQYETLPAMNRPLTTLDFASYSDSPGGFVMSHHSQFKCLRVVNDTNAQSPPHYVTPADLTGGPYVLNDCEATGTEPPQGSIPNPAAPQVSCTAPYDPGALALGEAIWGVVSYDDYGEGNDYSWGCVDECAEFKDRCPGFDPGNPMNTQCDGAGTNYGKLFCGCNVNLGGPTCDFTCPGMDPRDPDFDPAVDLSNLFVSEDYALAPRQGYWMCARPSATSGGALVDPTPGGYTLRGEVPAVATPTEPLCEGTELDGGPACTGYSVRAYSIAAAEAPAPVPDADVDGGM